MAVFGILNRGVLPRQGLCDGNWIFKRRLVLGIGSVERDPQCSHPTLAEDEKRFASSTEMCESQKRKSKYEKEDLLRWNDYGIGLLYKAT